MSYRCPTPDPLRHRAAGFTLTELAIVVFIVGLLLGGVVLTIEAQTTARSVADTEARLNLARDALVGFAIQNGRLPCPATLASAGREALAVAPAGTPTLTDQEYGECQVADGLLPALDLGLVPTDAQGFMVDAWSTDDAGLNRIRYAVTTVQTPAIEGRVRFAYTGRDALKKSWFNVAPDMFVCSAAPAVPGSVTCDANAGFRTAAVVYSLGRNAATAVSLGKAAFEASGASADEKENFNQYVRIFVAHEPRPAGANEFDDIVVAVPPAILINRMVSAGRL